MPHVVLKDYPYHLTKYEGKGTSKIPMFKLFSELGKNLGVQSRLFKNLNFSIFFMNWEKLGSIHSPRPTFQNPSFEYVDELGKFMS